MYYSIAFTSVRCIPDSIQQGVVLWVKGHSKGTIYDVTIDVCAKVQLHHIVVLQDSIITSIGSVVCRTVVQGTAGRKSMTYRTADDIRT